VSIVSRRCIRGEAETTFRHAATGKVLCRLDVKLSRVDFEQLQVLFGIVYRKGMEAGSKERAASIRVALGLEDEALYRYPERSLGLC